jgi:hypothetical protein
LVERIHGKDEVSGSTPDRGSKKDDLMNFFNHIVNLQGKTAIFIDMDGVIADYDNDPSFDKYVDGFYLKKRPIMTTIGILEKISAIPNVTLYLLSGHDDEKTILKEAEKNTWIDKHAPFFKKENRIFNSPRVFDNESNRIGKAKSIEDAIKNIAYDNVFQIDDDVRVIKGTNNYSNGKITMLHVISILD